MDDLKLLADVRRNFAQCFFRRIAADQPAIDVLSRDQLQECLKVATFASRSVENSHRRKIQETLPKQFHKLPYKADWFFSPDLLISALVERIPCVPISPCQRFGSFRRFHRSMP